MSRTRFKFYVFFSCASLHDWKASRCVCVMYSISTVVKRYGCRCMRACMCRRTICGVCEVFRVSDSLCDCIVCDFWHFILSLSAHFDASVPCCSLTDSNYSTKIFLLQWTCEIVLSLFVCTFMYIFFMCFYQFFLFWRVFYCFLKLLYGRVLQMRIWKFS